MYLQATKDSCRLVVAPSSLCSHSLEIRLDRASLLRPTLLEAAMFVKAIRLVAKWLQCFPAQVLLISTLSAPVLQKIGQACQALRLDMGACELVMGRLSRLLSCPSVLDWASFTGACAQPHAPPFCERYCLAAHALRMGLHRLTQRGNLAPLDLPNAKDPRWYASWASLWAYGGHSLRAAQAPALTSVTLGCGTGATASANVQPSLQAASPPTAQRSLATPPPPIPHRRLARVAATRRPADREASARLRPRQAVLPVLRRRGLG